MHRAAAAAVLVLVVAARPVAAENCVDKAVARERGGRPCMDVGTSLGRAELWIAPGLYDVRASVMRMLFLGNDADRRATGVELASWEAVGNDRDGLEAPRDWGTRSAAHVVTLRHQIDRDAWGAYLAGDAVTHWFGHTRFLTPRLGVRLGRFDQAAIVVEARLAGAFVLGFGDDRRSVTDDVDVGARATLAVARRLRLEGRARYRDLASTDGRRLRDLAAVVGIELEASPQRTATAAENNFRAGTLFLGLGVRRALIDERPGDDAAPSVAKIGAAPAAPWAAMAWLDLDFCINSSRAIW